MIGVGCACGLSFQDKAIQLHPNATPSREKRKYWDQEALTQTFGDDARDRAMEMTNGKGLNQEASLAEMFD